MTRIYNSILALALFLTGGVHTMPAQTQAAVPPAQTLPAPGVAAPAPVPQPPRPTPAFYRNLVVLDPAHGGRDNGAQLSSNAVEKDLTLAFAQKLRPALVAQGFTVVATRDSDPSDELTTDERAGIANHVRPLVCIVIHATAAGNGVHVVSSSLAEVDSKPSSRALLWNRAQEPMVAMSLKLANEVGLTLETNHLPVMLFRASVPPIDSLICPTIAIELAPLKGNSGKPMLPSDSSYQQRVITAIADGIASFRTHNAPPPTSVPGAKPGVTP